MPLVSTSNGKIAKQPHEKHFTKNAVGDTHLRKISTILRAFWPKKTSSEVAYVTGASERCVKFWLAGETRMSLENVVALLKTDAGFEILQAVLGDDCKAEWWLVARTAQDVRKMRKDIKKQEDLIAARKAQLDGIDQLSK